MKYIKSWSMPDFNMLYVIFDDDSELRYKSKKCFNNAIVNLICDNQINQRTYDALKRLECIVWK